MIEAIKSTLAAAPVVARVAEQASAPRSTVVNSSKGTESVSSEAFYSSRNVRVDSNVEVTVLEFRNPLNGDVKTQIPTEAQLAAYQRAELQEAAAQNNGNLA
jgi:hypothetical protein